MFTLIGFLGRVMERFNSMPEYMQILTLLIIILICVVCMYCFELYDKKKETKKRRAEEEKNKSRFFVWDNKTHSFVNKDKYNN